RHWCEVCSYPPQCGYLATGTGGFPSLECSVIRQRLRSISWRVLLHQMALQQSLQQTCRLEGSDEQIWNIAGYKSAVLTRALILYLSWDGHHVGAITCCKQDASIFAVTADPFCAR